MKGSKKRGEVHRARFEKGRVPKHQSLKPFEQLNILGKGRPVENLFITNNFYRLKTFFYYRKDAYKFNVKRIK